MVRLSLGIDRWRATGWTLARILENALCNINDGDHMVDPVQVLIAARLLHDRRQH
ncbi:MAG: hypothetical protein ACRDSE_02185 [Pseudonocardiaceae bacterium]